MFFPDDAVRLAALSEYVDRQVSDRLLQQPPEETMITANTVSPTLREPSLLGQAVVVTGSSGIGLKTARRARAHGGSPQRSAVPRYGDVPTPLKVVAKNRSIS